MDRNEETGLKELIKQKAFSLGFDLCGMACSGNLSEYAAHLQKWCADGCNDKMAYLCRDIEKRSDPGKLFPGARSLVVTGLNYYTGNLQKSDNVPVISRYAIGKDYHGIITGKLSELFQYIKSIVPGAEGKAFCDSSPILEKPWAVEAGLGWQGKNSVVINEWIGSFFFIGILILTIELEPDKSSVEDKCGACRLCINSCPTGAINEDRTIDARRCISNLTIENREPVRPELIPLLDKKIFGCDICQEVCPWNRKAISHSHPELDISESLASMTPEDWKNMDEKKFNSVFGGTPVERKGFKIFKTNIDSILGVT